MVKAPWSWLATIVMGAIGATLSTGAMVAIGSGCIEQAPLEGAACDRVHPCPSAFSCAAGACRKMDMRPLSTCYDDDDCSVGVCHVEVGFCVQCVHDQHCGGLGACVAGVNVCGCTRGSHCATGRCDVASGACIGCFTSEQCESGICDRDRGTCAKLDGGAPDSEERSGGPR